MKLLKYKKIIFLYLCFFNLGKAYTQIGNGINFDNNTLENILVKAVNENKYVFIDAFTSWCVPCKKMEANVFTNDSVADFYNSNFINMRIDMETELGSIIDSLYKVTIYPSFLYLNSDGSLIHRISGYKNTDELVAEGKIAIDNKLGFASNQRKYMKGNRDSDFLQSYLFQLYNNGMEYKNVLAEYFKTQKLEDLTSAKNWEVINSFVSDVYSREFNYLVSNRKKFYELYSEQVVINKITKEYYIFLSDFIFNDIFDEKGYEEAKKYVRNSGFEFSESTITTTDISYYVKKENYAKSAEIADMFFESDEGKTAVYNMNGLAADFYTYVNDVKLLERALKWSEMAIAVMPNRHFYKTYAGNLFKLGRKNEALDAIELSIKLAKEEGLNELTELMELKNKILDTEKNK